MPARRCTFWCHYILKRLWSGFSIPHLLYRRISCTNMYKRCMEWKSNMLICLMTSHPLIKQERNLFRRSWEYFFILRRLLIQQCSPRLAHLCPNKQHLQKNDAKMPSIFRLPSITKRWNHHLPSEWYETCNTQGCIVSIWTQGMQQSWRPHVHRRHRGHPNQQWSGTQYFANNQNSDVIARRGRTWRIVHQCQNSNLDMTHTQGDGTSANLHPHPNQQFSCTHTTHQKNSAQGIEGHEHAIPLVALLQSTGSVSILLETWNTEFGRLLDQASSSQPPLIFSATNCNACHYWYQEHKIEYS